MTRRARVFGVAVVLIMMAWRTRADGLTFSDAPLPAAVFPYRIAADGAGGVWLTDRSNRDIGHLTASGTYTTIAIPTPANKLVVPESIAVTSDGTVGFTFNTTTLDGSPFESDVGVVSPSSNTVTVYPMTPNAGVDPSQDTCANADCGIAATADGSFWFIEQNVAKIGLITNSASAGVELLAGHGHESEYPISYVERPLTLPRFILAPDVPEDNRALFTTIGGAPGGTLARIDTNGVLTVFPFTTTHNFPDFIALSGTTAYVTRSDGAIQLVDVNAGVLGAVIPPPVAGFQPAGMKFGPDGTLWVSDFVHSFLRSYTPKSGQWGGTATPNGLEPADIVFSGNKMYFVGFPPGSFDAKLEVAAASALPRHRGVAH